MTCFKIKFLILFFAIAWYGSAIAQQEYLFSHLGTHEGLVSNDIVGVQQDKKGFIWIGTFNGLQRYDGSRLLTFRHQANDSTSLPGNLILFMQIDKKGRLWLWCDNSLIGYFNTTELKFHYVKVRAKQEAIQKAERRMFMDEEGQIFLRLYGEPLLLYNEAADEFSTKGIPFQLPENWHCAWFYQDKLQHNYWIGCDSGLVKYNLATNTLSYRNHNTDKDAVIAQYAPLTHTALSYLDSKGRFWIISWPPDKLTIHSFNIHTKKEALWEDKIGRMLRYVYYELNDIKELHDGSLWFDGHSIFASFNEKTDSFDFIQNNLPGEYSIRYDMIYQLYEDRENNIWVGTNKGLYRFNPSAQLFHTISLKRPGKDTLYTPDVADITQIKNGDVLVSTWGSGIFAYDSNFVPKHLSYTEASINMSNYFAWCTHERANGDLWCGNQDGYLFIIHPASQQIERLRLPVFENSTIRQIAEDKAGNLWIGTQRGLLVKWTAQTNTFNVVQRLHSTIYRLYVDTQGDVWACTKTNGLYKINASSGSIAFNYNASGPARCRLMMINANDVIQYNDSLYVIASGGLNILNTHTNTISHININDDAFSTLVTNIIKDRQGLLWITTQNSLFSFNMQTGVATNYDESEGLQNINYNIGTSVILKDGRIGIGTVHNFVVFDPSVLLNANATPPKVEITGFALMNKWLPMDSLAKQQEITLPYDQHSMNISFSILTYQTNYAILYKLEGLDKEWINAKNNEAIYSYLPPGRYTFKVQAANANHVFSKAITSFTITVQAPFWKTWWFYSLLSLALIAFLYWLDRERMKRKAALQNMRSNISGNLHEEINSALQNINVLSEIARIKADKEPAQSKNYIDEIHHKSNNLIEAMDDMLWSIDPANDTMAHTISRVKEIAHAISHQYSTAIQVHNDDKIVLLKPDMKRRHELMQIYKMALQLLAARMSAPAILVQMSYIKNYVQLSMFAAGVKLHNSVLAQETIKHLKAKAADLKSSIEVQADEKGVGIILLVKR